VPPWCQRGGGDHEKESEGQRPKEAALVLKAGQKRPFGGSVLRRSGKKKKKVREVHKQSFVNKHTPSYGEVKKERPLTHTRTGNPGLKKKWAPRPWRGGLAAGTGNLR